MNVGDKVAWASQSGGCTRDKEGVVVRVVPPKSGIVHHIPQFLHSHNLGPVNLAHGNRAHESYLVEVVTGGPKARKSLYWPLVKNLNRAD